MDVDPWHCRSRHTVRIENIFLLLKSAAFIRTLAHSGLTPGAGNRLAMDILKRTDPFALVGAALALFLATSTDPWWSINGANNNNLFTMKVSPFYFHANATGLSSTVPFAEFMGPLTRILLVLAFVALGLTALNPIAWWRELAVYFSLSALTELYLSFMLLYHAAQTTLLGAYGVVPPYAGTAYLPTTILGLDLNNYLRPLVTTGFALPFFLGFVAIGLVGGCLFVDIVRKKRAMIEQRGVGAIFTSDRDEP